MGEQLDHIQHSSVLLDANREHKGDYKTLSLRLKNKSLPRQGSSSSIEGRRGDANMGPTMRLHRRFNKPKVHTIVAACVEKGCGEERSSLYVIRPS